ncbi:ATP-binding protein [Polynucleobacter rarus]|uniref:ATP-binding protein n=1 Tax=Polynucleobacter rarus TaxID=556055 RepID=UPI000D3EBBAF|nr:ATP-binding protein [Polynucleobacter rarus]
MIPRKASSTLLRLSKGFPIVAITGPRQSGKTTLAKAFFHEKPYVSLENLDERNFAINDPKRFLARFKNGAILDEVQRCPELLSWLQTLVDDRKIMGDFIITGSAQLDLMSEMNQSLAGRIGRLELLPLAGNELLCNVLPNSLNELLLTGGYPALYDREISTNDWFSNYVATYVERDIRNVLAIQDLNRFQRFLRLCAARSAQLLNLSSLANDCDISSVTAKQWLSVLEATYVVKIIHPYFNNFGKRLVKTPKLYFIDTGLMAWLLGIKEVNQLDIHPSRGHLFENWVVTELLKETFNQGHPIDLYFWRDHSGFEMDIIRDTALGLQAIEVKSGSTFQMEWCKNVLHWKKIQQTETLVPQIIFGGEGNDLRYQCQAIGWKDLIKQIDQRN